MLKFGETGQPFEQPGLIARLQLMLPDANHGPTAYTQVAVYLAVTGPVALDLLPPERRAGLRPRYVLGAAVPEAAVDEDGDAEPGEDKVRLHSAGGASVKLSLESGVPGLGFRSQTPGTWTLIRGISRRERQRAAASPACLSGHRLCEG